MRARRPVVAGLLASLLAASPAVAVSAMATPTPAGAEITNFSATVRVNADGSLHVAEAATYDFAGQPTSQLDRVIVTREHYDAQDDRVYDLDAVDVDAVQPDVDVDFEISSAEATDTISVEFAEPQSERVTVRFEYDVDGAAAETADGLEVRWPVVQGFDLPIDEATIRWNTPNLLWLSCLAGPAGSSRPCTTAQMSEVASPTMTQLGLTAGEQMVGIVGLSLDSGISPSADFEARWSLARSFAATGTPLWVALAVLALGLLAALALWLTRGRDTGRADAVAVHPLVDGPDGDVAFAPPSAVRPGQMGTLVDERVDVVDVSSTVIDLAVRNYLFVEELPHDGYGRRDWLLRRRNQAGDELLPYEREVFEALFADGDEVEVSALDDSLRERLPGVQALLYDDMVAQLWFGERPDSVRGKWTTAGWVLVAAGAVLTLVLALASTFGLVGVALTLAGVALAGSGQVAPARTARGSRVLGELKGFRGYLEEVDVGRIPAAQRERMISRLYPYALVFGLGERWADALAATDTDDEPDEPMYWYGAPADWHLSDAAPSMAHLSQALSAAIGSRRLLSD